MAFDRILLTKDEQIVRLTLVARAYDNDYTEDPSRGYHSIPYMENTPSETLALHTTDNTSLAIAVTALKNAGVDVEPTVGGLQHALGLSDEEMHDLACACHGHRMSADYMSNRVGGLVDSRQTN